jgi:hypothetical protein
VLYLCRGGRDNDKAKDNEKEEKVKGGYYDLPNIHTFDRETWTN